MIRSTCVMQSARSRPKRAATAITAGVLRDRRGLTQRRLPRARGWPYGLWSRNVAFGFDTGFTQYPDAREATPRTGGARCHPWGVPVGIAVRGSHPADVL